MEIFDYKTIVFEKNLSVSTFSLDMERNLKELGEMGWEVVSLVSYANLGSSKYALIGIHSSYIAVLKRKKVYSKR